MLFRTATADEHVVPKQPIHAIGQEGGRVFF